MFYIKDPVRGNGSLGRNDMTGANTKSICLLPGDGIGPEVLNPAVEVLQLVALQAGLVLTLQRGAIGGEALDQYDTPLPEDTLAVCRGSDALLLGAVGGPQWDRFPAQLRPEKGLLSVRKELGLYANLRPVRQISSLLGCSTLRPEVVSGVDLVVVRELTGGLYYGQPRGISGSPGLELGVNTMAYARVEIERIARSAFDLARKRRRQVTSVDKANVLEVSALWRKIVEEVHMDYQDVALGHQYVDNCAMQLVLNPRQFDVILTENTFGDILSDIGGVLTGSIGTLPSASLGSGPALYEPVHGSAPDIAGQDVANPIGAIACVALMFDISFGRPDLARKITQAIDGTLAEGFFTRDLCRSGGRPVGTAEFGRQVLARLK
jgi:3-isopropylmalate dehydrogenase